MSVKVYEINGEWLTWDHLHNVLGYTMTPSVAVSYKSAAHDTWGENAGDGYALNSDSELSQWSMWSEGIVGWFDANDLAEQGAYPASSANLFLERTGETAKAVSLDDGTNTYYLIDGYLDLGWRLWEVLEAEGWQISNDGELAYIVVDEETGTIVHSIVDEGMVYSEVGYVLMDSSSNIITVYETGVSTESFYFTELGRNETANTNISHADIPVYLEDGTAPAADTPYDGSSVLAFMDVTGNTKQADGESLYVANDVLRLDAPDTYEGEQWSALVERIEPAPSELTAYFTNQGAAGTSDTGLWGNYLLYDSAGQIIPAIRQATYTIVAKYNKAGEQLPAQPGEYLYYSQYGLMYDSMGNAGNAFRIVYTVSGNT